MTPRTERWFGSKGLEVSHGSFSDLHITGEEGWQFFDSVSELQQWLSAGRGDSPFIYSSNGLVVAWSYQLRPKNFSGGPNAALTFEVWQVFVKAKKPTALSGAHDEYFKKIALIERACTKPKPFVASPPGTLNGRKYSGRARDFLSERHISTELVERVIRSGRREEANGEITYYNEGDEVDLFYVKTDASGAITTIG